ncbi:MAG: FAD-binding oxidoreductase [Alphaproteobacteria bacterium]|nr:FAD-binding oxidoreductase [Alphaproteobacteria bacterium]
MSRFEPLSPWLSIPTDLQPALAGAQRADVAIIGGGYTGLCAALRLKAQGVDVAILESEFCGAGASGRNAGHLTPTIGKDVPTALKLFGTDKAVALVRFAEEGVAFVEQLMKTHAIECDYEPTGNITAGVHPSHRAPLVKAADAAQALGIKTPFLDEDHMGQRGLPRAFRFGVMESCGGILDPGKYVMGLRRAALSAGVRIYERTRVGEIEEGAKVRLKTQAGALSADSLLIATNAYTVPELGRLWSKIIPVRVSLFMTKPLTGAQLAQLGWLKREGIYTAHEILENYRFTNDNRILGGSKTIAYKYGSGLADGDQPAAFKLLGDAFYDRFPMLKNVEIDVFWGGWVAVTLDYLPVAGTLGRRGNIHYSVGCNGHGIAQFSMMGAAAGDAVLGKPWEELEVLQRRFTPFPPEPFRWVVGKALQVYLESVDRKIDNELRRNAA